MAILLLGEVGFLTLSAVILLLRDALSAWRTGTRMNTESLQATAIFLASLTASLGLTWKMPAWWMPGLGLGLAAAALSFGGHLLRDLVRVSPDSATVWIVGADGGLGHGFLVHPDGYILTAAHVADDTVPLWVSLANGGLVEASLVARKPEWDCALLRIRYSHRLPSLRIVRWKSKFRNHVLRVPVLEEGKCATPGIHPVHVVFPPLKRPIGEGTSEPEVLTLSPAMKPGFSGAAVCTPSGHVVGMVIQTEADSRTLAISSHTLKEFLRECRIRPRKTPFWRLPVLKAEAWRATNAIRMCRDVTYRDGFAIPERMRRWTDLETVVRDVEEALGDMPRDLIFGRAVLAWLWTAMGREDDALRETTEILKQAFVPLAHHLAHDLLVERGEYEKALELLERRLEIISVWPEGKGKRNEEAWVFREMARAYLKLGQPEEALRRARMAIAEGAEDALIEEGEALLAMKRLDEARRSFEEALKIDPLWLRARYGLMRVMLEMGGEDNLRQAIRLGLLGRLPNGFWETLARALEDLGWKDAAEVFGRLKEENESICP